MANGVRRALSFDVVDALTAAVAILTMAAWTSAIAHRGFDYDELEHAYAIWCIKLGLRPYRDFFECHPLFLWYPLSLLFRLVGDSYALLFICRVLAGLGHIAFFIGVGKNTALSFRRLPGSMPLSATAYGLAALVIAGHAPILDYLLEFRLDAWPNALLVFAIYRYRTARVGDAFRAEATLAFLCAVAILCSPKLWILVGLFIGVSILKSDARPRRISGALAGGICGIAGGVVFILALGLNPLDVYHLTITYHQLLNARGGFGHGLAREVGKLTLPLLLIGAGVTSWLVTVRGRCLDWPFELSIFGFLALQLLLVGFDYKQYAVPWILLGGAFVPYIARVTREMPLGRVPALHSAVVAVGILYAAVGAVDARARFDGMHDASADIAFKEWLESLVPPRGFVAAAGDSNPLFRRPTFYHVTTSIAPSGFDTSKIMEAMRMPGYSRKLTFASYRRDLDDHPPDLIVLNGWFPPAQKQAIDEYLREHAKDYRSVPSVRNPIMLRNGVH